VRNLWARNTKYHYGVNVHAILTSHLISVYTCQGNVIHALHYVRFEGIFNKPMPLRYPSKPCTIGKQIRKRRMDLKLILSDIAKILNVSTDCITNWENEKNMPQIKHFPKIHRFLGYCPKIFNESLFTGLLKSYR
jgi:DNA-binding XRE family transcriptional regulator